MTSKEKARAKRLLDNYNLSIQDWERILIYQDSVCFVCLKKQKSGKRLATDHRHKDGLIRGLLCSQCNRILGRIEGAGWHNDHLKRLMIYLVDCPATRALNRLVYGYPGRCGTKKHRKFLRSRNAITKTSVRN